MMTLEERPSGFLFFLSKVYAIAINTFVESLRQPVFFVIIAGAVGLIVASPYLTMFTLMESPKFIADMGLATIMLAGLLLATFTASGVVSDEIENKTVLTVVAKPVGRMEFILGKFLGVMVGLALAGYLMSLTLVLTLAGGSMEADIEQEITLWVILPLIASLVIASGYGIYSNFFNDRPFTSRAVAVLVPLFTLCFLVFIHCKPRDGKWGWFIGLDMRLLFACALVVWSLIVLAALAVAVSTRLSSVVNIVICSIVFLVGLLSDSLFREASGEPLTLMEGVMGFFVVAGIALLAGGVMVAARRYGTNYLDLRKAAALLGAGVATVWLPRTMPAFVLGVLAALVTFVLLAAALVLFLKESARLRGTLRSAAYTALFVAGVFGARAAARLPDLFDLRGAKVLAAKAFYHLLPNFQVFWVADLYTAGRPVHLFYVLSSGLYALAFVMAFFFLAVALFQERQLA